MTTTNTTPALRFDVRRRSLGALVAIALSTTLFGGFIAQYWDAPAAPRVAAHADRA